MKCTTEEFKTKAKSIHKDKYTYDKCNYVNSTTKITITCPNHGDFLQTPNSHLRGYGCNECKKETLRNRYANVDTFLEKAVLKYGNKYDYSKVKYVNNKTKVTIICPIHGEFIQTPNRHLSGKCGCTKCGSESYCSIWSYSDWEKAGEKSKHFEGYSVYLLECWNESEKFYKVGKTYTNINKRYGSDIHMPYRYKLLKQVYGDSKTISELENTIKTAVNSNKYIPKLNFGGSTECFCIDDIDSILSTHFT